MIDHFDDARNALLERLAEKRRSVETGGVNFGGVVIRTDAESQAKVSGALLHVGRNPNTVIDWKGANGWGQLTKTQVEAISDAVAGHVQACFTAEKNHWNAIQAITDIAQLEAYNLDTGWPG
jgi:hypothetical protein